jgi:glycosyltransferase involved in cell wall biosynthesis
MKQNKFKIITPSYNNEEWVEYNLASILNQTYTNYDVMYIDDCSKDGTYEKVTSLTKTLPNWTVVRNEVNRGAAYNYVEYLDGYIDDPNDIIIHLDGDDWLIDDSVLEQLNDFYNRTDCWMSYGGFVCWEGYDVEPKLPYPQSTPYPDFIHKHKKYRQDLWRPSHLRTYRAFLFQALEKDDLKMAGTNEYYWHAADLAWQFPCMEMCSPEKIGVVDFYTLAYNHSKQNQVRTHERENVDNSKYEVEVRNRKTYREGIGNGKLPQIRVFGDYRERNSIPTEFTYTYEHTHCEYDITLLSDTAIIDYVDGKIPNSQGKKVVAEVAEPAHLMFGAFNQVYECVLNNHKRFDRILTSDNRILALPNAMFMNVGAEVVLNKRVGDNVLQTLADEALMSIYEDKSKLLSVISSNKIMSEGHVFRLQTLQHLYNNTKTPIDFYGQTMHSHYLRGILKDIDGKIDGLRDYMFSIAIENGVCENYFTEKILDCFLTGTIPIYHGCPNISDFFDVRGIIIFDTQEELVNIVDSLTEKDYIDRKEFLQANFEKAMLLKRTNDDFFNKYIKDLI